MIIFKNYNIKNKLTTKIDCFADYYVEVESEKEFIKIMKKLLRKKEKFYILGNGSKVVFRGDRFDGYVISTRKMKGIKIKNNIFTFSAGEYLSKAINVVADKGYKDILALAGVPATIGGAVRMNAGAYGKAIGECVKSVKFFDLLTKKVKKLSETELNFSYRKSDFMDGDKVILEVELEMKEKISPLAAIEEVMKTLRKRGASQPFESSCGSIFKRKEGVIVSKLLDEMGMKGCKIGGAKVSEKHAGFIINEGSATAGDYFKLATMLKEKVKNEKDIDLEFEVIFVGEEWVSHFNIA